MQFLLSCRTGLHACLIFWVSRQFVVLGRLADRDRGDVLVGIRALLVIVAIFVVSVVQVSDSVGIDPVASCYKSSSITFIIGFVVVAGIVPRLLVVREHRAALHLFHLLCTVLNSICDERGDLCVWGNAILHHAIFDAFYPTTPLHPAIFASELAI